MLRDTFDSASLSVRLWMAIHSVGRESIVKQESKGYRREVAAAMEQVGRRLEGGCLIHAVRLIFFSRFVVIEN